jgi:drug/metabolite transporter (DMT)-like permease
MKKEHHGFLYGLLAAFASAISALFIKLAVSVPNETMVFVRFFVAFLFILPGVFLRKVHLNPKLFSKHIARGLTGLVAIYCYFYSVKYLSLLDAVTISNTAPLFTPLVVFLWLKLIIPKARIWALLIGFLGILMILRPGSELGQWAMLVGLLGGLSSSFALIGIRQLSKSESTGTIMTYYFIISLIISFPPMIFTWKPIDDPMIWFYLILIALMSLAYQFFLVKSLTHAPATKVSTMTYLSVVFSGLFGWWFFGEIPGPWNLCGIALIVIGGLLALFSNEPPRQRKG